MGIDDTADLDETLEHRSSASERDRGTAASGGQRGWIVVVAACLVFLAGALSPPRLMDDVDAVQAQIARSMLASGDWTTARLDGIAYLEKSPLIYWMMAVSYRIFGVHDWAARLPLALSVVLLCWVTYRFAAWAFGKDAGLYAGLALSTSVGLFLFTRILIPDAIVTLSITGAIWACLQLLEPDREPSLRWSLTLGACLGTGLLLKGLIAVVFPVLALLVYMALNRCLFDASAWKRLRLGWAIAVALLIALPWHVIATLRNPPYFVFSLHSGPGEYKGFFWFYFFNEHLLRFLNLRYPRDYNTVPRIWFWLFNLIWIFPWSAYLISATKLSYQPTSRAGRVRRMAVCWIGVVLVFFTFSTTQEYYSMPIYPAVVLLIGPVLSAEARWVRVSTRLLLALFALLFAVLSTLLMMVWKVPAPGSIAQALTQHPALYSLSLGHMGDLTLNSFAYLKLPLGLAASAFGVSALALAIWGNDVKKSVLATALGMVIFFQAARIALIRFDSYLGSYPLAQALEHSPPGDLIEAESYYNFSSVFFYTNRTALLWNGRINNLEYGSNAPGAPHVFIDDDQLRAHWQENSRWYLLIFGVDLPHLENLVGKDHLHVVAENAGNYLLSNLPLR